VADIEIGFGKSGRRAYGLDEITIVPARRTRDPDDVDISWEIDAYRLPLPLLASAMDSVVSPETAGLIGKLGGIGVLNIEGLWTRYEDPAPAFEAIRSAPDGEATARMQEVYAAPLIPELIGERVRQMREHAPLVSAAVTPQRKAWRPVSRPARVGAHSGSTWKSVNRTALACNRFMFGVLMTGLPWQPRSP